MYLGVDDAIARVVPTKVPNVRLLAQVVDDPEAANPADVVATQRQVIREARRRFDVVLLDTAPLLSTNDAAEVLETADLVVLVSRAGQTRREAADRCAELLERRKAPVVGVAMIAVSESSAGSYYYYDRYYTPDESAAASEPVPDPRPVQVPAS
jgi:Mrp family chromosome partitioning ATPase